MRLKKTKTKGTLQSNINPSEFLETLSNGTVEKPHSPFFAKLCAESNYEHYFLMVA